MNYRAERLKYVARKFQMGRYGGANILLPTDLAIA